MNTCTNRDLGPPTPKRELPRDAPAAIMPSILGPTETEVGALRQYSGKRGESRNRRAADYAARATACTNVSATGTPHVRNLSASVNPPA